MTFCKTIEETSDQLFIGDVWGTESKLAVNKIYILVVVLVTGMYVCQNSFSYTLKKGEFIFIYIKYPLINST